MGSFFRRLLRIPAAKPAQLRDGAGTTRVFGQARRDITAGEWVIVALDLITEIEASAAGLDIAAGPLLADHDAA